MAKAVITTSWDDGHPLDLKLAEMLARYGVPSDPAGLYCDSEMTGMFRCKVNRVNDPGKFLSSTYRYRFRHVMRGQTDLSELSS